jgi:hypothetical protein
VSADAVADAIVAVVTGRTEAWVPKWLRIASTFRAVAPSTYRRLAGRFGETVRLDRVHP